MKAYNIKNGVQFSCDLKGEKWRQGNTISGVLEINDPSIKGKVILALGTKKKINSKDPKAYIVIDTIDLKADGGAQNFEFELASDCSINETYILFGTGEDLFEYGNLLVKIEPSEIIEGFLEVFNIFFKFKTKKIKSVKSGFIEATLEIPKAKEYSNMLSVKTLLKIDDQNLVMNYEFTINKVDFSDGHPSFTKEKMIFDKTMNPKEYLMYGALNQDRLKDSISKVVNQVKKKQLKI